MQQTQSLPAEITIYTLGAIRAQCLEWLSTIPAKRRGAKVGDKPWPIDASRVDEIDAAGVQLLLSLSHSLTKRQRTLRLVNPSEPLAGACEALGVSVLLAVDEPDGVST